MLIAIIVIVVAIAIVCIVMNKGEHGYTVNRNEILKINQYDEILSIKVDSVDSAIYLSGFYESEKTAYTGVKLTITNNSNKSVSILPYNFVLLDSNNNELDSENVGFPAFEVEQSIEKSKLLTSDISAGQTVSGYLYFETDSKDIKKLKIACPTKNKTKNRSVIAGNNVYFEYYYINL